MVELYVLHIISLRGHISLMNILQSIKKILREHEIPGSISRLSTVTLILSLHGWVMGSVNHFTEVNI